MRATICPASAPICLISLSRTARVCHIFLERSHHKRSRRYRRFRKINNYMSIFIKSCPECAQPQPVAATRCHCGYCFDGSGHGDNDRLEIELIAEEEKLYLEYLEARAAQAEQDLSAARAEQLKSPADKAKATAVLRAERALTVVQQELSEQRSKTQAALATARKEREAQPRKPAPAPVAAPPPEDIKLELLPEMALVDHKPPPAPAPVERPAVPVASIPPLPAATSAQKAPQIHRAKFAKTVSAPTTAVPDASFRATQAAKAEKALRQAKEAARARLRAAGLSPAAAATKPSPQKPAQVRLVPPLEVPDRSLLPSVTLKPATKECPNCTATNAETANRCRCGYAFPSGECELPGISLGSGELSILANGLNAYIGGRRG